MEQGITRMPAVDDFLKTVLRSGLLDRAQLQQSLRTVPRAQRDDPQALANHLVKAGKLSRFQAGKLLKGTALGLVLGPFQVLAPLGKGGMGTVYLARDNRSGQLLALKVLPPRKAREEERLLARFRREMEMCQRVAHPHIAWTFEVGVCQGVYYIAMEYIPGKSLYRVVGEQGPLPVPRAARLFAEVASALDHAHHQGLIHRDLKPSNIIITPRDHAKLLDLGLAICRGESCADRAIVGGQGYVLGTMDYIAPEQADDPSKADARCDVYALGCTLYYALTGRPPYPGGTALEKIHRHHTEEPAPVPQLNPAVPPAFIGLLRKMMARNPAQRFPSAAAVREELVIWAAGEPVLPMDKPEDAGYQEAVASVEAAEPSSDAMEAEVIPDAVPTAPVPAAATLPECPPLPGRLEAETPPPDGQRRGRPSPLALAQSAREPRPTRSWGLVPYLIVVGGVLVLGGVGLAVLLYFLLGR
jgi:serine/threonine protein kinase